MKANPNSKQRFAPSTLLSALSWLAMGWLAMGWLSTGTPAAFVAMAQDVPSPLSGYATFAEMEARLAKLAESPHVSLRSLGVTTGKRNLWLLTISKGESEGRPGIVILGNVVGSHVVGREISLQMAEQIVSSVESNPAISELLDRFTLYVIPNPTPDETEKHYRFPIYEHTGNETRTDDDRDFSIGEDPPKDLNGDGWITSMRVHERFATHRSHSSDGRVLVPIDPKKGESGEFRIFTEGMDADGDDKFGEDASDGVAFNKNFPFNYPYFGKGAGPHQVSEIESRSIADFLYDHPNIGAVVCFSPEDNLFNTWKGSSQTDSAKIKSKILTSDQIVQDQIAEQFRSLYPNKDAPESPTGEGSFSEWAYLHYGRWTFASRGWWVPKAAEDKTEQPTSDGESKTSSHGNSHSGNQPIAKDDKRGDSDLNALKWFEQQGIPAFSTWQAYEHPGLPGKKVEIGGWKPLFLLNPPHKMVGDLIVPHVELVKSLAAKWPQVELRDLKAKQLGKGLIEVSCEVINVGQMPTMPEMAGWSP
ncbi:MAG: M14 family metallopeptidase [Pirellula sp.]|nr:M14 family metallopeptidase [Pirellula sp.]